MVGREEVMVKVVEVSVRWLKARKMKLTFSLTVGLVVGLVVVKLVVCSWKW